MRFIYFYAALVALQLWAGTERDIINQASPYEAITRPLILLSLWIYFWRNSQNTDKPKQRLYTLVAIILYWLGEMTLTINDNTVAIAIFFLSGHLCYIAVYNQDHPLKHIFKSSQRAVIIIFIGIVALVYAAYYLLALPLFMRFSMIVFLLIDAFWFLAAFNRVGFVPRVSEQLVLAGVICFLCANCLYGLNHFSEPLWLSNLVAQTLIFVAHYCLVEGILKNQKS
jgi:uncharacterized membrane protein YhhN